MQIVPHLVINSVATMVVTFVLNSYSPGYRVDALEAFGREFVKLLRMAAPNIVEGGPDEGAMQ